VGRLGLGVGVKTSLVTDSENAVLLISASNASSASEPNFGIPDSSERIGRLAGHVRLSINTAFELTHQRIIVKRLFGRVNSLPAIRAKGAITLVRIYSYECIRRYSYTCIRTNE